MRILLLSDIDAQAEQELARLHEVIAAAGGRDVVNLVKDCDVLVFRSGVDVTREVFDAAPQLRLIVRAGSGLDNFDLPAAREKGVRAVRIPGPSARAVAEFTFGLLLAVARHISHSDALIRSGSWPKKHLAGELLEGRTLGVVGAGNIGSAVCELGSAWGMRVLASVSEVPELVRERLYRPGVRLVETDRLIGEADFLTLHVPLNPSTQHLVDAAFLKRMKPGSILVNTSRGGVVDESALYAALVDGHLAGAGLDVHEREGEGVIPPFADLPNVVLTPHIAAMAHRSQWLIGRRLLQLVEAFEVGTLERIATEEELVL